jgi:hypothetical protein
MRNYYTLTNETQSIYNSEWGAKSPKQNLGDEVQDHKWKTKTDYSISFLALKKRLK